MFRWLFIPLHWHTRARRSWSRKVILELSRLLFSAHAYKSRRDLAISKAPSHKEKFCSSTTSPSPLEYHVFFFFLLHLQIFDNFHLL